MQYPASVMTVGVARDDSCVVTGMMPRPGMMDGLVQIHTRKVEEMKDGVRTNTRRYIRQQVIDIFSSLPSLQALGTRWWVRIKRTLNYVTITC